MSFFAVLIMDGDSIGANIGEYPKTISTGLSAFTKSVKDYFDPNAGKKETANPANGVLIYAGGDDVLALVPVDSALQAALSLQGEYTKAFEGACNQHRKEKAAPDQFTMSGALVFAQYKIPLRSVLRKAHHYLDKVAKERNGRDSLALAVMKPGGIASDWVTGWQGESDLTNPVRTMLQVAKKGNGKSPVYSNSFFYNIRERYAPLFDGDDPDAGNSTDQAVVNPDFMRSRFGR